MPSSGRGGKRNGKPGASYGNRSDLQQAPRAAPNQPYGVAAQQIAGQKAVPLAQQPMATTPPPSGPMPGSLGPLHAPTDRPSEPLTAGLAQGPGPGPSALGNINPPTDPTVLQLRALYQKFPNRDVARLLDAAEARATSPVGQG